MPLLRTARRFAALAVLVPTVAAGRQPPPSPAAAPGMPPAVPTWPSTVDNKTPAQWIAELRSPDPGLRETAIKVLPAFGPDVRKYAVKPLIEAIGDGDPGVRVNAMLVLGQIGFNLPDQKDDVHRATTALGSAMSRVGAGSVIRLHAARVVGTFGTEGHEAVGSLCDIAADPSWETRATVADALGRVAAPVYAAAGAGQPVDLAKPPAPKRSANAAAMNKLRVLLADPSARVRVEAAQGLLRLGPPHFTDVKSYAVAIKPYMDTVAERLKTADVKTEKDPAVRIWLMMLQSMYDGQTLDANVQKIASQTDTDNLGLKIQALTALSLIGPKSKDALPQITDCLRERDPAVVVSAVAALLAVGEQHRSTAISELERILAATTDKDRREFYKAAAEALRAGKKEIEAAKDKPRDDMPRP